MSPGRHQRRTTMTAPTAPTAPTALAGAPCWIDLMTSDPGASGAFYGPLFGWTASEPDPAHGGYVNFSLDGRLVAGCMRNDPSWCTPDVWSVYLATDDIASVAETTPAHGGQVIVAPMPVDVLGTMAVVTDAGGATIGAWQAGQHRGFEVIATPGAPAWFELHTRDYEAAVRFYEDVFGWDTHAMSDTPEFRYTTLGKGDTQAAGIMDASAFLPEGAPAQWSIYFSVADTDAALAKAVELGGVVVMPGMDTPFGRLAEAADPTGAHFKLVSGG